VTIRRYVKRPVEIEAIQFSGEQDSANEILEWAAASGSAETIQFRSFPEPILSIRTLEGDMKASPGDYIIRGIAGEFHACKPDIFDDSYEVVREMQS
jgi:hypothetical protein